jgi:thymidylate synthase (FAD)
LKIAKIEVDYLGGYGSDATVVNAARVSFHKACTEFQSKDAKLIKYLADHKHLSPFNHAFLSFRVKAPIFVARQLVKHKFLPWNEVSRRYVDEEPEFYWPDKWRAKAENVKQGSSQDIPKYMEEEQWDGTENDNCYDTAEALIMKQCSGLVDWYQDMVKGGVAPEQARMVLPQNMMTEWIWSGTLGAFLDMLVLRLDPHTQKESRDVAELIAGYVQAAFPISYQARIHE